MRLALLLGIVCGVLAGAIIALSQSVHIPQFGAAAVYLSAARSGFYIGLAVGGCAYAIRRGGGPERLIGIIILTGLIADPLLHQLFALRVATVDPTHSIIDISRFVAVTAVALLAYRFWPIWLSAFQLLALGAHVTKAMQLSIHPVVYATMSVMWSYGMLILLIGATWHHRRLLAQGVMRKSWSSFSRRLAVTRLGSPQN